MAFFVYSEVKIVNIWGQSTTYMAASGRNTTCQKTTITVILKNMNLDY